MVNTALESCETDICTDDIKSDLKQEKKNSTGNLGHVTYHIQNSTYLPKQNLKYVK